MRREFYFQDDRSNKFWCIELDGTRCTVFNGRVGAQPRSTEKLFDDAALAQKYVNAQIASKLKSGYIEGQPPAYQAPDWSSMTMNDAVFWRLIGLLNWKKLGDDDAVVAPLVKALSQMQVTDIEGFESLLAEKLYALDTREHARHSMEDGDSDYLSADLFLYTRSCVVANGKDFYEKVKADPRQMPVDADFEPLLYVAGEAYAAKTGEEFDFSAAIDYETGSNAAGWAEDKR